MGLARVRPARQSRAAPRPVIAAPRSRTGRRSRPSAARHPACRRCSRRGGGRARRPAAARRRPRRSRAGTASRQRQQQDDGADGDEAAEHHPQRLRSAGFRGEAGGLGARLQQHHHRHAARATPCRPRPGRRVTSVGSHIGASAIRRASRTTIRAMAPKLPIRLSRHDLQRPLAVGAGAQRRRPCRRGRPRAARRSPGSSRRAPAAPPAGPAGRASRRAAKARPPSSPTAAPTSGNGVDRGRQIAHGHRCRRPGPGTGSGTAAATLRSCSTSASSAATGCTADRLDRAARAWQTRATIGTCPRHPALSMLPPCPLRRPRASAPAAAAGEACRGVATPS